MVKKSTKKAAKTAKNVPKKVKKTAKKASAKTAKKSKLVAKKPKAGPDPLLKKLSNGKQPRQSWLAANLLYMIIALGVVVIIAGVSLLISQQTAQQTAPAGPDGVAATINGQTITNEQLEQQYNILPDEFKQLYTKERVLQQLIDEEIVLQWGETNGISVSPDAIDEEIAGMMDSGLTQEQLELNLQQFNMTLDEFRELVERKLMIEQTMERILINVQLPSEEEVRAFYDANKDQFSVDEEVTVRHILIGSTRENAAQLGKELVDRVKAGEEFCELVDEYTDDVASKDNCGEYTFGRNMMVPEFEKASFELADGEVTLVQTQFGYHVIQKIGSTDATIKSFDEVKQPIADNLYRAKQSQAYQDWLADQKQLMNVQIYYTE